MKIVILGPGDSSKIWRNTNSTEKKIKDLIHSVGKLLAEKDAELVILPARGIPYSIAKAYKKNNGKKIIGLVMG